MKHKGHKEGTKGTKNGVRVRRGFDRWPRTIQYVLLCVLRAFFVLFVFPSCVAAASPPAPQAQSVAQADAKSAGCMSCHTATDRHTMHQNPGVVLGCADCHGGDAKVVKPDWARRED